MKKNAIALAVLLAATSLQFAHAARTPKPVSYTTTDNGSAHADADGGAFSQTFTITTPGSFNGILAVTADQVSFSGMSASLGGNAITFSPSNNTWIGQINLGSSTTYSLTVTGTSTVGSKLYSVQTLGNQQGVTITPVPEPETYAMFLAGLGLMGGIARRRSMKK